MIVVRATTVPVESAGRVAMIGLPAIGHRAATVPAATVPAVHVPAVTGVNDPTSRRRPNCRSARRRSV
jgi:hypothetical protein